MRLIFTYWMLCTQNCQYWFENNPRKLHDGLLHSEKVTKLDPTFSGKMGMLWQSTHSITLRFCENFLFQKWEDIRLSLIMIRFNRIQGNIFQITSFPYVAIWTGLHLFRSFSVWLLLLRIFEITYLYRKKNFEKPLLEKLGKFLRLCLKCICATMPRQEQPPFLVLELQCIFICA